MESQLESAVLTRPRSPHALFRRPVTGSGTLTSLLTTKCGAFSKRDRGSSSSCAASWTPVASLRCVAGPNQFVVPSSVLPWHGSVGTGSFLVYPPNASAETRKDGYASNGKAWFVVYELVTSPQGRLAHVAMRLGQASHSSRSDKSVASRDGGKAARDMHITVTTCV